MAIAKAIGGVGVSCMQRLYNYYYYIELVCEWKEENGVVS